MKRKSRSSLFFVWAFAILACLVLVLFALIFSSCGEGAVSYTHLTLPTTSFV